MTEITSEKFDGKNGLLSVKDFVAYLTLALQDSYNAEFVAFDDRIEVTFESGEKFEIKVTKLI